MKSFFLFFPVFLTEIVSPCAGRIKAFRPPPSWLSPNYCAELRKGHTRDLHQHQSGEMKALVFSSSENAKGTTQGAILVDRPVPPSPPAPGEATVRVLRAGVCATDLEIVRGYVPGFEGVLGHEFVGQVVEVSGEGDECGGGGEGGGGGASTSGPSASASWLGARVVADINCRPHGSVPLSSFSDSEEEQRVFARNHEPGRTVLGIVGRDGALAELVSLPVANLHRVPASLSDRAAAFAEPLAAALRVVEQGPIKGDGRCSVAVVGDGRLGLLVAAVLAVGAGAGRGTSTAAAAPAPRLLRLVHFGRRPENLRLVPRMQRGGEHETVVVPRRRPGEGGTAGEAGRDGEAAGRGMMERHSGAFDVVVEASGSSSGIELALSLCRPLGTVVLKTTCAPPPAAAAAAAAAAEGAAEGGGEAVFWASVANDAVVNEKRLVGSRCGPIEDALAALERHPELVRLVESMVRHELPLDRGVEALKKAAEPGALKVQVVMV